MKTRFAVLALIAMLASDAALAQRYSDPGAEMPRMMDGGAYPGQFDERGMMGMMMGGQGGMGMMSGAVGPAEMMGGGMGPLSVLDLSDEQIGRINKIHDEQRRREWELMGKIMDEQIKLRDLYSAETLDAKKIGSGYAGIAKLQQQIVESRAENWNKTQAVLTADQREQLKGFRRGMMGAVGAVPGDRANGPGGMMRR